MTYLLDEQNRLKKRLLVQARLAKLDVSEVRSTESEALRRVNQALLDNAPSVPGVVNPFSERNLTDAQRISEDMIRRQGRPFSDECPKRPAPPSPRSLRSRRKLAPLDERPAVLTRPRDWFSLKGPLVRYYRRSVERGYKGCPEAWLRSAKAVCLYEKLSRKGFTLPHPETWDCFSPRSPLRWALNKCSAQADVSVRQGFLGERIRRKDTNVVTLRRQASSVQRLKISDWPSVPGTYGRSWPNYPTLGESWTMSRLGKFPIGHYTSPASCGLTQDAKVPARQVKPGLSARTVSKLVLGIRADIEVPRKFLGYFRYRWGFLILHRHNRQLPKGLVKHLVRVWKEDISGLFLKCDIRYNDALRRMPTSARFALVGFAKAGPTPAPGKTTVRRRPGKATRLRAAAREVVEGHPMDGPLTPSSDKSDGGARLC